MSPFNWTMNRGLVPFFSLIMSAQPRKYGSPPPPNKKKIVPKTIKGFIQPSKVLEINSIFSS